MGKEGREDKPETTVELGGAALATMFQLVLDSIPTRVFWKDTNSVFLGCNRAFSEDAGLKSVNEIVGKQDLDLAWSAEQAEAFRRDDAEVMQSGTALVAKEEPQDHEDGKTYWLETSKIPLKDPAGKVIGILGTYSDITERKTYQQKIEHMALHDALTGLPNRSYLSERLEAFSSSRRDDNWAALLFIDLDQFKAVNDTLGHSVGDKLLCAVVERLNSSAPEGAIVSRISGDEFSVFVPGISPGISASREEAEQVALQHAETMLAAIREDFDIDEHRLYISASIGIAMIAPDQLDLSDKLRESDMAMYEAKGSQQVRIKLFESSMAKDAERRHALQSRLRNFSTRPSLRLEYQPQLDADNRLIGCEALLRWTDPQLGVVSPAEFVPLAEKTGLIHEIGEWVMRDAFNQLVSWECESGLPEGFRLAINISAAQFQRPKLADSIVTLARQYAVKPEYIEFEVTESLPLGWEEAVLQQFETLHQAGFGLVFDDFGIGYSSLSYLSRIPLDKLKIDRSFVSRIDTNKRASKISQTIIQMGKSLGVSVIAEGVELQEERDHLEQLGCRNFQGYLFSRALEPHIFAAKYLQRRDKGATAAEP